MRTDVKLGVVFALVLVLAAGGYFMSRGEKQTPISLAEQKPAVPDAKPQPSKPAPTRTASTPSKPGSPSRPSPKPATTAAPNSGVAGLPASRPANPVNNPATSPRVPVNTPAITSATESKTAATPPRTEPNGGIDPAANTAASPSPVPGPAFSGPANTSSAMPVDRESPRPLPSDAITSLASPASPQSGSSLPESPDRVAGALTPLANNPMSRTDGARTAQPPPTLTGTASPLPPGIKSATSAKPDAPVPVRIDNKDLANAAVETHRVQSGDSLTSLAETYYGDAKYAGFLAQANPKLADPNRLRIGMQINIPPLPANTERIASGGTPAPVSKPNELQTGSEKRTYTVKSGDSFYSIAKAQLGNASRWKELLALNNSVVNGDPTSLQPGQKLVLP